MKNKIIQKKKDYKKFSKVGKESEINNTESNCPTCQCCNSKRHLDKDNKEVVNLCVDCYSGNNDHKKLGKPKSKNLV